DAGKRPAGNGHHAAMSARSEDQDLGTDFLRSLPLPHRERALLEDAPDGGAQVQDDAWARRVNLEEQRRRSSVSIRRAAKGRSLAVEVHGRPGAGSLDGGRQPGRPTSHHGDLRGDRHQERPHCNRTCRLSNLRGIVYLRLPRRGRCRAFAKAIMDETRTGGEWVVEALRAGGVRHVFGLPGVHNLAIYDALLRQHDIAHIPSPHAPGAAFSADGHAPASGRPGVVVATTGPGATNVLTPLVESFAGSQPVLALMSDIPAALIGKGLGALHEVPNQIECFKPVSRWAETITDGRAIACALERAF